MQNISYAESTSYLMNILKLIGRSNQLFEADVENSEDELRRMIANSRFLVIGGAGSIGQAVTLEIFKRDPKVLHIVDISENNMVELVRNIRSTMGYGSGDFRTFAIDAASMEYEVFLEMKVHMTMS